MTTKPRRPSGPKPKHNAHLAKVPPGMEGRRAGMPRKNSAPKPSECALAAIALLSEGKAVSIADAARQLGRSRENIHRQLAKPHVRAWIVENVKMEIAASAMKAWAVKRSLLGASSEHVRSDVASEILAMSGIAAPRAAPAVSVNFDQRVQVGYVIDISEPGDSGVAPAAPCALPQPQCRITPDRPHVLIDGEIVRPHAPRTAAAE